jgi:hypothetical protein
MELKLKGKKADITDSFAFLITLVILGVGLFIMAWIVPQITNGLNQANLNNSAEGANAINQLTDFGINGIQRGFFFLFIGLCIAQLISAFYLDTHPIWLFLYVIFLGITIILGAYLGNMYEQVITNSAFAGFTQGYITVVMKNLLKISLGVGALSMIIIFSKWAYFSGGQRI